MLASHSSLFCDALQRPEELLPLICRLIARLMPPIISSAWQIGASAEVPNRGHQSALATAEGSPVGAPVEQHPEQGVQGRLQEASGYGGVRVGLGAGADGA